MVENGVWQEFNWSFCPFLLDIQIAMFVYLKHRTYYDPFILGVLYVLIIVFAYRMRYVFAQV